MSYRELRVGVVIPTRNEASALPHVLRNMPSYVDAVVVGDYRSTDGTDDIARSLGATVVAVTGPGYGRACLEAMAALPPVDVVVFVDGDAADDLDAMSVLLDPLAAGEADFTLGARVHGQRERGSLTPQQVFGNWLACTLMRWRWGVRFSDLGPFRAIRWSTLQGLQMRDLNYGWTIEMQVKIVQQGVRFREYPTAYRRRIGTSKVSGTLVGTVKAGVKILWIIGREAVRRSPPVRVR